MSRIGKKPVPIPKNVEVSVDGTTVKVKGPKGELTRTFVPKMKIRVEDGSVVTLTSQHERTMSRLRANVHAHAPPAN